MPVLILDGRALARAIEERLTERMQAHAARHGGEPPILAIVLVGADAAAMRYARKKADACRRVGMEALLISCPAEATTAAVLQEIDRLNDDPRVHGVLLQYPVPSAIDLRRCFDRIASAKDVGGDTSASYGRLALGDGDRAPATPAGIMRLLSGYGIPLAGQRAVVVGDGAMLARPLALLLLGANATVTVCPADTPDLKEAVHASDIVVGAAGRPEQIKGEWIRPGAVVIDTGYHPGGVGDVELPAAAGHCAAYTPVPGGAGPMTIAVLLERTLAAAERAAGPR
jgi:methylenetetrahydrofolate dehydrogenase (NADP+)/methenyltetrahydrofolate cyclohydrolase